MGHTVTILNHGLSFEVERHESILDAAVKAGIAIDYSCGSGNCGNCKARLIEGELLPLRHQDYVFSAAEKATGYALMCCNSAASDLVIEADVARSAEDIEPRRIRVKVRKLDHVSDELLVLHMQTPRTERLRFLAGQYANLDFAGHGDLDASIASCPCDDRRLEFHIRRRTGDPVSDYIFDKLAPGRSADLVGPMGSFVLDEQSRRPLVLIAFDTGFAAAKSLLEHATAQESGRDIRLFWIACNPEGQYLDNLCRSWRDALDEFRYTPISLSQDLTSLLGDGGRGVDRIGDVLEKILGETPEIEECDTYVCAPEVFLRAASQRLTRHGVGPDRVSLEPMRGNPQVDCLAQR